MFIELPLPKITKGKPRTLICGVGVNDAPYYTTFKDQNGKQYRCPFYTKWKSLIERTHSGKCWEKYPNYKNCTIEPSWLIFTNFRAWMEKQDWQNKDLDKDLLIRGNKHYGPDTCLFISQNLNKLLCLRDNFPGQFPIGVNCYTKDNKHYIQAIGSFYGKSVSIGYFATVEEAAVAYKKAKITYIEELAKNETNPIIKDALIRLSNSPQLFLR
jgi:hypothetical protein